VRHIRSNRNAKQTWLETALASYAVEMWLISEKLLLKPRLTKDMGKDALAAVFYTALASSHLSQLFYLGGVENQTGS
jgi:hypothetical protein